MGRGRPRKHPSLAAYNRGCHCDDCSALNRARRAGQRAKGRAPEGGHGYSGYTNYGCRCDICSKAGAEANAASAQGRTYTPGSNKYAHAAQADTLSKAKRHGQQWTGPELETAARTDLTERQVAEMLGRSMYAVRQMRRKLRDDPRYIDAAGVSVAN